MALDRAVALVFLALCLAYGYTAFFLMDEAIAPFMRRNPVWPSTFPKALAVLGAGLALAVLLAPRGSGSKPGEIDWRRLHEYELVRALALVALMVAYALLLRPAGFLLATFGFLAGGGLILGERRLVPLCATAAIAAGGVWWLVQEVLGIFLRPLPLALG